MRKHVINETDFPVTLLRLWASRDALSPGIFFSCFCHLVGWLVGLVLLSPLLLSYSDPLSECPQGPALTQKGNRVRGLSPLLHR